MEINMLAQLFLWLLVPLLILEVLDKLEPWITATMHLKSNSDEMRASVLLGLCKTDEPLTLAFLMHHCELEAPHGGLPASFHSALKYHKSLGYDTETGYVVLTDLNQEDTRAIFKYRLKHGTHNKTREPLSVQGS